MKNKILSVMVIIGIVIFNMSTSVLAAGNCAFAVGGSFNDLNIEEAVTIAANAHTKLGYHSYYAKAVDYATLNGYFQNGTRRLESDILFLTGHGNYDHIRVGPNAGISMYISSSEYIHTANVNWANTKLVTLMGCSTGKETSNSGVNIAFNIFEKSGYKSTTLGWRNTIYDTDIVRWANRYYNKLLNGGNLREAIDYANSYNGYYSNTIKDLAFYGEWSMVPRKSAKVTNLKSIDLKQETNILRIKENISFTKNNQDINAIIAKLEDSYPDFNINDFEITIHLLSDTEDQFTIDFDYKIGDFYTNEGYVVSVRDGKVYEITNNMSSPTIFTINNKENSIQKLNTDKEKMILEEAKENLKRQNKEISKAEVETQEIRYFINRTTNEKSVTVLTQYKLEDGSMGGNSYTKQI